MAGFAEACMRLAMFVLSFMGVLGICCMALLVSIWIEANKILNEDDL